MRWVRFVAVGGCLLSAVTLGWWMGKSAALHPIRPIRNGKELPETATVTLPANMPIRPYLVIPMRQVLGDGEWAYAPNDASVGDLNGDGEYELVIKRERDSFDPAQNGVCRGTTKLEAYKLERTRIPVRL
jgi:rhamnogalacturonan endolyase